jgi:hypothetical protein
MVNLAGLPKQAGQTSKQTAQNVAKRIAQEQLEFLKSGRDQLGVLPEAASPTQESRQASVEQQPPQQDTKALEQRLNAEAARRLEELEAEMAKYRQQREQNYQQKIKAEQQVAQPAQVEAPKAQGKVRKAMGAMKQKLTSMTSKAEKQRNVSG